MLKQLRLRREIEIRRSAMAEVDTALAALKVRSDAAAAAIDEAQSDDDLTLVDTELDAITTETEANTIKKTGIEEEIRRLEAELEGIGKPASGESTGEEQRKDAENHMNTRARFFAGMDHARRNAIFERDDVKEFVSRVRDGIEQKRAVTGGDLLIPNVMLEHLRDNLDQYSKLISKVNLRRVPGTARQNISGAVPEGIWTEMCGKINQLSISFSQIEVDGWKVGGYIAVCNALLEDSDISLADEVMYNIAQAIGLALDKAIVYGKGLKMPLGFVTRLAQTAKPSNWGDKAPAWKDLRTEHILKIASSGKSYVDFFKALIPALGAAKPNYSRGDKVFWAMNRKTWASLQSMMVAVNSAGAVVSSLNNTMPIIGGEIVILEFVPDNDIVGGYGDLYLLAERAGAHFERSEHVQFLEDNTVFKGTARYDGRPVFGEGFVALNINNANPTTAVEFAPDTANAEEPPTP